MFMIRRTLAVAALLTPLVYALAVADPATQADSGCGGSGASSNGVSISTFVCLYLNSTPVPAPNQSTLAPGQPPPPVCWLEPQYTPTELKTYITTEAGLPESVVAEGAEMYGKWLAYYGTTVKPPYELRHSGWWWGVGCDSSNLNASTYAAQIWSEVGLGVFQPWEWEATAPPPTPGVTVITPAVLAEYARDAFSPPQPQTQTSPVTTQTVGLTTYFAGTTDATVNVAATVPGYEANQNKNGLTENVVGTPEMATIDITTVTASGATVDTTVPCLVTAGAANATGQPPATSTYGAVGTDGLPTTSSCSYTPTQPGTSSYTVAITWSWNWLESEGAAGWPLTTVSPVEQVGPLNVQEVQAINNN